MTDVILSDDGSLYYVPKYADGLDFWLSVAEHEPKPVHREGDGVLTPAAVLFDGKYVRDLLPFVFFKVRHGDRRRVGRRDKLVRDWRLVKRARDRGFDG